MVLSAKSISIRLTDETGKQIMVRGKAALAILRMAEVQDVINSEHFKGKIAVNVGLGDVDVSADLTIT